MQLAVRCRKSVGVLRCSMNGTMTSGEQIASSDDVSAVIVMLRQQSGMDSHAFKAALEVLISMLGSARSLNCVLPALQSKRGCPASLVIARGFYRALGIGRGSLTGTDARKSYRTAAAAFSRRLVDMGGAIGRRVFILQEFSIIRLCVVGVRYLRHNGARTGQSLRYRRQRIYTLSEVMIGIATGSLIIAPFFPQKIVPALMKWRGTALAPLMPALRSTASGQPMDEPVEIYLSLPEHSCRPPDLINGIISAIATLTHRRGKTSIRLLSTMRTVCNHEVRFHCKRMREQANEYRCPARHVHDVA